MRRFNILHILTLGTIGLEIYNLYKGATFGPLELALLVAGPVAAVLSFIVHLHDSRVKEGLLGAFDGLLVGTLLGLLVVALIPAVYTASFGWLIAGAIGAGVFAGFLCPKRYRDGLRI